MAFTENDLSALSNMLSTFKENLVDDIEEKLETTIDKKLEAALLPVKEQLNVIDIRLGTVEKKITFLEAQQTTIILALDQMNQRLTRVEEKVDRLETKVDALETKVDALETKVDALETKVDALEIRIDRLETCVIQLTDRVISLESRMDAMESRMDTLEADVHAIKVDLLENNIIPRLNEIESCYLGTYKRYQESAEKAEAYFADTEMLKKTVEKHSEQLRKLA